MIEAAPVEIASALTRWLGLIALLQAAGAGLFLWVHGRDCVHTADAQRRSLRRWAVAGVLLAATYYLLGAARMGGDFASLLDPSLQQLALRSAAAPWLACTLCGQLLIAASAATRAPGRIRWAPVGVLMTACAFALTGHTLRSAPWSSALLMLHVLAVAFWFGALLPLVRVVRLEPPAAASRVVERFSAQAIWIVPGLSLAGLALAGVLLPGFEALRSAYGRLLLVKLGTFGLLMLLAAANRWRFAPALARADGAAARHLRTSAAIEYALICLVLGVTTVLTGFFSPT